MGKVLVVDDEAQMHTILGSSLEQDHHVLSHASGVSQAREAIRNGQFEAILTAQKMSDGDGVDVLTAALEASVSVILLAGAELPIDNMLREAVDVVALPSTPEVVRAAVRRACRHTELLRENAQLKVQIDRLKDSLEIAQAGHNGGNGNGQKEKVDVGWIEALPSSFDLRGLLAMLEKSLIERTLQSTGGAQAEAARRLGLSRSDLSYKLLKYELRKETTAAS
jgi:DNA-binding NtrC family response regulator